MDYDAKAHKRTHMLIVGNKLRRLIHMTDGCTQEDVAMVAGYTSNSMVNQQIKGKKMIPAYRLNKIAEHFNLPEGYLSNDVDYDQADLRLLIATHRMIKEKATHPHYRSILSLHGIK